MKVCAQNAITNLSTVCYLAKGTLVSHTSNANDGEQGKGKFKIPHRDRAQYKNAAHPHPSDIYCPKTRPPRASLPNKQINQGPEGTRSSYHQKSAKLVHVYRKPTRRFCAGLAKNVFLFGLTISLSLFAPLPPQQHPLAATTFCRASSWQSLTLNLSTHPYSVRLRLQSTRTPALRGVKLRGDH